MLKKFNLLSFCKDNLDLSIAFILALISSFLVEFNQDALVKALNLEVLLLLACLMLVVAGFRLIGILDFCYKKCFALVANTRSLARLFIFINFFISMLVTNDVSLIIFVPLAINAFILIGRKDLLIQVVSLQTIAANMGSMLTPIGNPQNLFIYTYFNYDILSFFKVTAPTFFVCFFLLIAFTHHIDTNSLKIGKSKLTPIDKKKAYAFSALFLLCILCVLNVLNVYIVGSIVVIAVFFISKRLFLKVDYKLLSLFLLLFIFVHNITNFEGLREFCFEFVGHYEYFVSLCLSQIISNVPATVMLSTFVKDPDALLLGVNVGGLGTIIASMASLISFKAYVKVEGAKPLYYLKKFTKYNLKFLLILIVLHFVIPSLF